jgi:hypothetical protein
MQNAEEKVALQAVEFWSTVCDEEAELMYEAQEVSAPSHLLSGYRSGISHLGCFAFDRPPKSVPPLWWRARTLPR